MNLRHVFRQICWLTGVVSIVVVSGCTSVPDEYRAMHDLTERIDASQKRLLSALKREEAAGTAKPGSDRWTAYFDAGLDLVKLRWFTVMAGENVEEVNEANVRFESQLRYINSLIAEK
jgi:hypothetical protein